MKSDPVRSAVRTSAFEGVPVSASGDMAGGTVRSNSACCAATVPGAAANAAAPAAALFRKFRRSTGNFFGSIIAFHLCLVFAYPVYNTRWKRAATGWEAFWGAVALAEHCPSAPLTLL